MKHQPQSTLRNDGYIFLAIGIVYGDIGTSLLLYVMKAIVNGHARWDCVQVRIISLEANFLYYMDIDFAKQPCKYVGCYP